MFKECVFYLESKIMETYDYLLKKWPTGIDYIMAIDESGTSQMKSIERQILRKGKAEPDWFVLSGIIFTSDTMLDTRQKIINLKNAYWCNGLFCGKRVVLHSTEMQHRSGAFSNKVIENYDDFLSDLCQIIDDSTFQTISVCINKTEHLKKYTTPYPVYEYALALMLERYSFNVKNNKKGILLFESRNGGADKELLKNAEYTFQVGTKYVNHSSFDSVHHGIYFNPKRTTDHQLSYFMLEFADLLAYSLYRKYTIGDESKIYECMKTKFIGYPEHYEGQGLKVVK